MKVVRAEFVDKEKTAKAKRPAVHTASALLLALVAFAVLAIVVVFVSALVSGCRGDWNKPRHPTPQPGAPCGFSDYYQCEDVCCYETDICRPGGYCAYGGFDSPAKWNGDAGEVPSQYRGLTPAQVQKVRGRP